MKLNTVVKIGLSFVAGLAIGAIATKKIMEKKFEEEYEIVETDVEEIEEDSDNDNDNDDTNNEIENKEVVEMNNHSDRYIPKKDVSIRDDEEYDRILNNLRYKQELEEAEWREQNMTIPVPIQRDLSKPYDISYDEFSDADALESDEYTVYADGYVTDSYGMPVGTDDIENLFGLEFMSYFGRYGDDDQIYIRNERLQMDFSIIRDVDNFVDVAPPRIKRMVGLE